ncbi:MAG TPA: dihydroorotate dehydrogenase-like protein [Candidatus Alistipes faecigallinarum]|uniref:dihydroorotate dehydrogenase-like protein n=1 Tax=uncultured Alistipes sp. TaxID=538949 RepID=UPI001F8A4EDD|nr:dihydroorotate dehydrogenase-like protein [uncultured Alistipes sp.]HIY48018.1 dihydroorotate dehydrogenase-like protein [Candidatus Alistipes faecigallinarum]
MKAKYLGLELSSPVIVSSSPYTSTVQHVEQCARQGAGAVVLKSIFEEQILREAASLERMQGYGDAGEYLERYLGDAYKNEFLQLVQGAAATGVPVIASINCVGAGDAWVEYARSMQQAGAAALELNIFLLPTDRHASAQQLEQAYADIVRKVAAEVTIPVSVKLPMRLTNVLAVGDALLARGARGVVLFNRFFEPDIDIEKMSFVAGDPFSQPSELRNVLRSTALCAHALPQLDVAVSTGVHDGEAAVKALLCGAAAVQVCTAIHLHGYEAIGTISRFVDEWAARHGFDTLDAFRGRMDYGSAEGDVYQRVQYMKYFPHGVE